MTLRHRMVTVLFRTGVVDAVAGLQAQVWQWDEVRRMREQHDAMLPFSHVMQSDCVEIEICVARRAQLPRLAVFFPCLWSGHRPHTRLSTLGLEELSSLHMCLVAVSSYTRFPATVTVALMLADVLSSDYPGVSR